MRYPWLKYNWNYEKIEEINKLKKNNTYSTSLLFDSEIVDMLKNKRQTKTANSNIKKDQYSDKWKYSFNLESSRKKTTESRKIKSACIDLSKF